MKDVHALLPRLISKEGHIFPYHTSMQEALQLIQWNYTAYIPKKAAIFPSPLGWQAVLANDLSEKPKNLFQKLVILFTNIFPLRRIFKNIQNQPKAVLFIEHFEFQHLAAITTALFWIKPEFQFWILYRYEFGNKKAKIALYRLFLKFMNWKCGTKNVKCLTDSELLAEVLQIDLQCPISVVPIPHTDRPKLPKRKSKKPFLCWWPGSQLREDKGLFIIQQLLKLMKNQNDFKFIIAEKAKGFFSSNSNIDFISSFLSREEYLDWMQKADLILLPYSGENYSRRTSGIFVEAVSMGSMPVTTKNTWMAYELTKFGLQELIFCWDEENLIDQLTKLPNDPFLCQKLEKMTLHYQNFHTQKKFSEILIEIARGKS